MRCSNAKLLVYPIRNIIGDDKKINFEKYSPDDWIKEGDDVDIVLSQVKEIDIESIAQFHGKIQRLNISEKTEIQLKRGKPNLDAMNWLYECFQGRLMYVSETSQFYYYQKEGVWDTVSSKTLLDSVLEDVQTNQWSYTILENALKLVAPKFKRKHKDVMQLFINRRYIGFQNGVWDFETSQLLPHSPHLYISGLLPFNYVSVDPTQSLQTLCPNLCTWIIDRANNEEIYTNILIAFLLLAVLDVRNPQRFLFLSGYSATGKSTYLTLLERLVPPNKSYITTSETIASNFGLQDFTGISKTLLICHDIGSTVSSAFVNLLRNLVSSGEAQNVQRKFESAAKMQFEGVVALASNKNPFTQQQREGILDRRMVYVPFINRVHTKQIQDFDTLFPPHELKRFISFAVHQDSSLIVQFIRIINEDVMVRQILLESFQENLKSLHLQNFITRRIAFCEHMWVPLGSSEDTENFHQGVTLYSAYLRYTDELGVSSRDIFNYQNFNQEFLPLLNRVHPEWTVKMRRRQHPITAKKVPGFVNIQLITETPDETETPPLNLEEFRQAPFWVVKSDEPETMDTSGPSWTGADTKELLETTKHRYPPVSCSEDLESRLQTPAHQSFSEMSLEESVQAGLLRIHNLLLKVPKAGEEPKLLLQPELGTLQSLFQTNPVIALDTEFAVDTGELAYIQIDFLSDNTVCILSYRDGFAAFAETFFNWLNGTVAILGFFMIVDLIAIWRYFKAPPSEKLLYKVFDFYLFLKFMHNGFENQNSLAHWAKRLCSVDMDKSLQKTDWFSRELTPEITNYLKNDVWVLHKLLNYVQETSQLYYYNTWTKEKHYYFETSYKLDQVLIPCFLEISLQGISIDTQVLANSTEKNEANIEGLLSNLGLTSEKYNSPKHFSEFINHTILPIGQLKDIWPRTKKANWFIKSKHELSAWLTKHTADARFKQKCVLQWFTDFLLLADANSLNKFFKKVQTTKINNKIFPLWDIMGTDTGRITTSKPPLHSTPRDSTARSIVVPSQPENVFVILDYKTIELAIQAILANEEIMLSVFKNGWDLHIYLASKIQNTSYEQLLEFKQTNPKEFKNLRNSMKPVNFGKTYGMGPQTLWQRFLELGFNMSYEEAKALHRGWDQAFPKIKTYQNRCKTSYEASMAPLTKLGGTHYITSLLGRIRRPLVTESDQKYLNFTQIINFPIQATCSDFLKSAVLRFYFLIKRGDLPGTIVLTAHDEIIFECKSADAQKVVKIGSDVMIAAAQQVLKPLLENAPIGVDSGIGNSWQEKP